MLSLVVVVVMVTFREAVREEEISVHTKKLYQQHHKEAGQDTQKLMNGLLELYGSDRMFYLKKARHVPAFLPLEDLEHDHIEDCASCQSWKIRRGNCPSLCWSRSWRHLVARRR